MSFRAFSNPYDGDVYTLSARCASQAFAKMMTRIDDFGRQHGLPEIGFDRARLADAPLGHWGWSPEMGSIATAMTHGITPDDWSWVSGQTRLALLIAGLLPSAEFEMEGRHPTAVAGHLLPGGRLLVRGDSSRLTVHDGDERLLLDLTRRDDAGANCTWTTEDRRSIIRLGSGRLAVSSRAEWQAYWQPQVAFDERSADPDAYRRKLETYVAFLEEHSPEYYVWSVTPLRELVLLEMPSKGGERSASFMLWPAQVHISEHEAARNLATLVHEAAHQYFNMGLWLSRVVTADAPEVHSELRGVRRPLEMILLGYHAVANSILALAQLPTGTLLAAEDKQTCERWLYRVARGLGAQLEVHGDRYLTEHGKDIYLPLKRRLDESGLLKA